MLIFCWIKPAQSSLFFCCAVNGVVVNNGIFYSLYLYLYLASDFLLSLSVCSSRQENAYSYRNINSKKGQTFDMYYKWTFPGADYGLGTIGTCLGPPPARGPPSDQKNENPTITVIMVLKMQELGHCRIYHAFCKP